MLIARNFHYAKITIIFGYFIRPWLRSISCMRGLSASVSPVSWRKRIISAFICLIMP